jgi:hypothetical protein
MLVSGGCGGPVDHRELEATGLLEDERVHRSKGTDAYFVAHCELCGALLHQPDALRLHHGDRLVTLVLTDATAAIEPLAQRFHQLPVDTVELVTQRLQHSENLRAVAPGKGATGSALDL